MTSLEMESKSLGLDSVRKDFSNPEVDGLDEALRVDTSAILAPLQAGSASAGDLSAAVSGPCQCLAEQLRLFHPQQVAYLYAQFYAKYSICARKHREVSPLFDKLSDTPIHLPSTQ